MRTTPLFQRDQGGKAVFSMELRRDLTLLHERRLDAERRLGQRRPAGRSVARQKYVDSVVDQGRNRDGIDRLERYPAGLTRCASRRIVVLRHDSSPPLNL